MLHLHRRAVVLAIFVGIFFTAAPASPQTTIFTVPGATDTRAFGISPSGEIVGLYTIGTEYHGFLLSRGQLTPIDYPGAFFTNAAKINPQGDVVGLWFAAGGNNRGYLLRDGQVLFD